jgi:hypothetical protein
MTGMQMARGAGETGQLTSVSVTAMGTTTGAPPVNDYEDDSGAKDAADPEDYNDGGYSDAEEAGNEVCFLDDEDAAGVVRIRLREISFYRIRLRCLEVSSFFVLSPPYDRSCARVASSDGLASVTHPLPPYLCGHYSIPPFCEGYNGSLLD